MATTTVLENVVADSIQTDELNSGNLIVRGAARFANPIYADIHGAQDINKVTSSTAVADTDYVLVTNGTSLKRVLFTDFVAAVRAKL